MSLCLSYAMTIINTEFNMLGNFQEIKGDQIS